MDATNGLTPHPSLRARNCGAGFDEAHSEKPVRQYPNPYRPAASSAYSLMLGLLETLKNLAVFGQEPAPFLVAVLEDDRQVLVAGGSAEDLTRLRNQYGSVSLAFQVSGRAVSGGLWLEVSEPTGETGYRLNQFCRRAANGVYEALPHCWSRSSAPSAYQSTSGLIPNWGLAMTPSNPF